MLEINLQQIIQDINNRRNRVRYPFQELALMLAEKLQDPRHKGIYMKLAKYEEQELLMDAMNHVLLSSNVSGNRGALFMWKLKELKGTTLEPLQIRFYVEGGYFVIGSILRIVRGDMPLIAAGLSGYQEKFPEELVIDVTIQKLEKSVEASTLAPFMHLKEEVEALLTEFKKAAHINIFSRWQFHGEWGLSITKEPVKLKGALKLGTPVLTRRPFRSRIHSS